MSTKHVKFTIQMSESLTDVALQCRVTGTPSTQRRVFDLAHNIGGILDFWPWAVFNGNLLWLLENHGFHGF